jgi:hypothetical protein
MTNETTERGFQRITHREYPHGEEEPRIVQQSSAIGCYHDSFDKPGSSFLWIGKSHRLNREEVAELVERMKHWLATGRLFDPPEQSS